MAIMKDLIVQSKEEWKNEYDYSLIEKEFDINMKVNKKKDIFPIIFARDFCANNKAIFTLVFSPPLKLS